MERFKVSLRENENKNSSSSKLTEGARPDYAARRKVVVIGDYSFHRINGGSRRGD